MLRRLVKIEKSGEHHVMPVGATMARLSELEVATYARPAVTSGETLLA